MGRELSTSSGFLHPPEESGLATLRERAVAAVTRRYPLVSGCGTLSNSMLLHRLAGPGSGTVWARVPGGEVLASLNDYVGRAAFYAGDLDKKISRLCRRIVRPGDTVLDIGANIGMVTLLLSRLVGPAGRVHSFEPNPRMQQAVTAMVQRNGLANVTLHPVALGSEDGELELRIPYGNIGAASLIRTFEGSSQLERCQVPVRTLSGIVEASGIKAIRLIKIDVEGFESEVFRGAEDLLARQVPDAILFELDARTTSSWAREPLVELLAAHGYGFLAIPRSMFRATVQRVELGTTMDLPGHDVLAAPMGRRYDELAISLGAR